MGEKQPYKMNDLTKANVRLKSALQCLALKVMSDSHSPYCCLCQCFLTDAKGKGRHRKFNGKSVSIEKEILKKCAAEFDCLEELQLLMTNRDSIICYNCISKLNKLEKLKEQVQQLTDDIAKMLHSFRESQSETPQRVKRARAPSRSAKRIRTSVRFAIIIVLAINFSVSLDYH